MIVQSPHRDSVSLPNLSDAPPAPAALHRDSWANELQQRMRALESSNQPAEGSPGPDRRPHLRPWLQHEPSPAASAPAPAADARLNRRNTMASFRRAAPRPLSQASSVSSDTSTIPPEPKTVTATSPMAGVGVAARRRSMDLGSRPVVSEEPEGDPNAVFISRTVVALVGLLEVHRSRRGS